MLQRNQSEQSEEPAWKQEHGQEGKTPFAIEGANIHAKRH